MLTYPVFPKEEQVAVLAIPINLEKISQDLKNEFKLDEMTNIIVTNEKSIVIANLLYPSFIGKPI
jgi:hypothetical protein